MTIKIRPSEQVILDAIAVDANSANLSGILVQPATPYATLSYPVPNYSAALAISGIPAHIIDSTKGKLVPLMRYVVPIYAQASNIAPSFSFTANTTLLTLTLPETLEVPRTAVVNTQFTLTSSAIATTTEYWIEVNGTPSTHFKILHSDLVQKIVSGSWVVTLPITAVINITLHCARASGSGNLVQTGAEFSNLTLVS